MLRNFNSLKCNQRLFSYKESNKTALLKNQEYIDLAFGDRKPDSNKARTDISEFRELILDGLKSSRQDGKYEKQYYLRWGNNEPLFEFFKPILNAYGITFDVKQYMGEGESGEYLQVEFPEEINCNLVERGYQTREYTQWLEDFAELIDQIRNSNDNSHLNIHNPRF